MQDFTRAEVAVLHYLSETKTETLSGDIAKRVSRFHDSFYRLFYLLIFMCYFWVFYLRIMNQTPGLMPTVHFLRISQRTTGQLMWSQRSPMEQMLILSSLRSDPSQD